MKKFLMQISFFGFLAAVTFILSCKLNSRKYLNPNDMIQYNFSGNYDLAWQKADSLEREGLTRSALEIVEEIYVMAKKDGNQPQFIKSIFYKLKFTDLTEENSDVTIINDLKEEAKNAEFPAKAILQSTLAKTYWIYYQNNRWSIQERTETVNFDNDDFKTWDLKRLVQEISKNYQESLENADSLKKSSIVSFFDILVYANIRDPKLRPTLYDLLANNALEFYISEESSLPVPVYKFTLKDKKDFSSAKDFIKIKYETKDTMSLKFKAIELYQQLIAFHFNDVEKDALIDVDLARLNFVRLKSAAEQKDLLYLSALEGLEKLYAKTPFSSLVVYHIAKYHFDKGIRYDASELEEDRWELKEAMNICESAIANYPVNFGVEKCLWLQSTILTKTLDFKIENANLPNEPFRSLLSFKNVKQVFIKVIPLKKNSPMAAINDLTGEELVQFYNSQVASAQWSVNLPDDQDYQQHSVEIEIPPLHLGRYLVMVATDQNIEGEESAITYAKTWVTNFSVIKRQTDDGTYEVFILDRKTGFPIAGSTVAVYEEKYVSWRKKYMFTELKQGKTNDAGKFEFAGVKNLYGSYKITITKGDDFFESDGYFSPNFNRDRETYTTTQFYLDRAIYRPGQVVYFKGILYETDDMKASKIIRNSSTTVMIRDANNQVFDELELTTNEFGTFHGKFTLPVGIMGGSFQISNGFGSKYLQVEEYKRPTFEVQFEALQGSYSLNDDINVSGNARTYSGANLNDVEVKYRVVRSTYFPYFDFRSRFFYNSYLTNKSDMEIANGVTKTDDQGHFNIIFSAIPDLSLPATSKPVFNYRVVAEVVDVTGETHATSTNISVGYVALIVDMDVPEIVNSELLVEHALSTSNLNGQFESADVSVEVHKLKSPDRVFRNRMWPKPDQFILTKADFYNSFSHDVYNEEDQFYNWPIQKTVFKTKIKTTDNTTILFKKQQEWEAGKYLLLVKTKDKNGTPIELTRYFTLFKPDSDKVPLREAAWFYFDEKNYEPGDTTLLYIGTAEKKVKALYEIEYDGKIIYEEWITLNDEQKKIEIPIKEDYRGNLIVHLTFIKNNESHILSKKIVVPWTNKQLNIAFETFRDKILPGATEIWKLKVSGPQGDAMAAELLASMYDASLDAFVPNSWAFSIYPEFNARLNWSEETSFQIIYSSLFQNNWNNYVNNPSINYPRINYFGFEYNMHEEFDLFFTSDIQKERSTVPSTAMKISDDEDDKLYQSSEFSEPSEGENMQAVLENMPLNDEKSDSFTGVSIRKNLNETAFFYPELLTDENGDVIISFTAPEALTRWKFMALATTKDLKSGLAFNQTLTQKELMISPNPPRFLREGDEIYFTAKVSNLSDGNLKGQATLQLFDAFSMKPIDDLFEITENVLAFAVDKGMSEGLSWRLKVPVGKVEAIVYRVIAKADDFSDGEENALPILVNRMLVTETLPLPVKGNETRTFVFDKLKNNSSSTLQNYNLTLEFTSNPAWYAIQALPYMMEFPYECSEQIFSRYYANSIATHIANSSPNIKKVFEGWKTTDKEALLSNLEKNQDLKSALLEETPWVLDAQNESERKHRIGLLFDLTKMSAELDKAEQQLRKNQLGNGSWPWFPGMPESRYITQHIVAGFGHLERLGIKDIRKKQSTWSMLKRAVGYMDKKMYEDYQYLKKNNMLLKENNLGYLQIQYLYGRTYYLDIPVPKKYSEAFDYWNGQAKKYWLSNNKYMQGMIALSLHRLNDETSAKAIVKSILENAVFNDEMGMYFKNDNGYYWFQAPIETQALLIEAFDEISDDQESVDLMKVWLLKQKQVQGWKTTKATAEACYALLLRGNHWLEDSQLPTIKIGESVLQLENNPTIHIEEGTGYFKTSWKEEEIDTEMAEIEVTNNNDVVSWGSVYWQYFEQLDKITQADSPLNIKKQLFLELDSETGKKLTPINENTELKPGDKVIVRIEIRVNRDMEFVHLKDMRAAGLEPINVLSTHKYQDGLWYYESTRDLATNFFMDRLPKGTYVFEYPLRVNHRGDFSNGITTIQSMYAPEFSSHSEGIRVEVE
jgi:5-hydroxyisourate hydrolase-like protein (transthyretin family)